MNSNFYHRIGWKIQTKTKHKKKKNCCVKNSSLNILICYFVRTLSHALILLSWPDLTWHRIPADIFPLWAVSSRFELQLTLVISLAGQQMVGGKLAELHTVTNFWAQEGPMGED